MDDYLKEFLLPCFEKNGQRFSISNDYPYTLAPYIDIFPQYVTDDGRKALIIETTHKDLQVFAAHIQNSFIKAKENGLIDNFYMSVGYIDFIHKGYLITR